MRETREKVEKMKRESLEAVYTSSFNKQIKIPKLKIYLKPISSYNAEFGCK